MWEARGTRGTSSLQDGAVFTSRLAKISTLL